MPASRRASTAAKGASIKADTKPELRLRQELWRKGLRYRKNVSALPGIPDLIFQKAHVAIFCDGDFWHGKGWKSRKARLTRGANAEYWISKIERNIERDRKTTKTLKKRGWIVLRFWESEIQRDIHGVLATVYSTLHQDR